MSTFARFFIILFPILALILLGTFFLAGGQFHELIFLSEQKNRSFLVLDFHSQLQVEKGRSGEDFVDHRKRSFEIEGGELKLDLGFDFAVNKDTLDHHKRLNFYEFADHYEYLYAITDPSYNDLHGAEGSSISNVTFAGYGQMRQGLNDILLVLMLGIANDDDASLQVIRDLKASLISLGGNEFLEFSNPVVLGKADWNHLIMLDFKDRQSAIELLESSVFQSELLLASTKVTEIHIGVYR